MAQSKRILQVLEEAYRCTIEEQDDPTLWITHAMRGAGAELGVLLSGGSVSYAVRGQDATGLRFGSREQTQPPRLDRDLSALMGKGVPVHVVAEDLGDRGLEITDMVEGVNPVRRAELAELYDSYDQIWHW